MWGGCGVDVGWAWDAHGVGMGWAWDVHGVCMGCTWGVHGVDMGCAWGGHGVCMGCTWGVHGVDMGWTGVYMGCIAIGLQRILGQGTLQRCDLCHRHLLCHWALAHHVQRYHATLLLVCSVQSCVDKVELKGPAAKGQRGNTPCVGEKEFAGGGPVFEPHPPPPRQCPGLKRHTAQKGLGSPTYIPQNDPTTP